MEKQENTEPKKKIFDSSINSLEQYLAIVKELSKQYPSNIAPYNPTQPRFLFRGQANTEYKLLPNLFRKNNDEIHSSKYFNSEIDILQDFINETLAYNTAVRPDDLVQWAEIAQHYGVPTRFLDWTSNSLVALYFACINDDNCDGAIWVFNTENYYSSHYIKENSEKIKNLSATTITKLIINSKEPDLPQYPFVFTPRYIDSRMSAQSSWFMTWGLDRRPLDEMINKDDYMQLNLEPKIFAGKRVRENYRSLAFLFKVNITSSQKRFILRDLEHIGINAKTLFPGMDGVGKYIERKYRSDLLEQFLWEKNQ